MRVDGALPPDPASKPPAPTPAPQQRFDAIMAEAARQRGGAPAATAGGDPPREQTGRAFGFSELGVFGSHAALAEPVDAANEATGGAAAPLDEISDEASAAAGSEPLSQRFATAAMGGGPISTLGAAQATPPSPVGAMAMTPTEATGAPSLPSAVAGADGDEGPTEPPAPNGGSTLPSRQAGPAGEGAAAAVPTDSPHANTGVSVVVAASDGTIHILVKDRELGPDAAARLRRAAKDLASTYALKLGSLRLNGLGAEPSPPDRKSNASFTC